MNLRKYIPKVKVNERPHFNVLEIRIRNELRSGPLSTLQLGAELYCNEPKKIIEACERMDRLGYVSGGPIKGIELSRYENPLEGYKWKWEAGPTLLSITFGN
jgi:hypothetical protein